MTTKRYRFFLPVVFAGLCLVLLVQQQAKPETQQQTQPKSSPAAISAPAPRDDLRTTPTKQENGQSQSEESTPKAVRVLLPPKDFYDYFLLGLDSVLAAVGVGGLWLAFLNLGKLGQQTGQIKRQADLMEQEIGILKQSTDVSRIAAEAAQRNVEALIAKERAHLSPLLGTVRLSQKRVGEIEVVATLKVANYGATNAFIDRAQADIRVYESSTPEYDPFINFFPLADLLPGDTESEEFIFRERIDMQRFERGEVLVHLFGTITFRDVFLPDTREVSFYFVWDHSRQEWERKGEEYNKQT